MNHKKMILLTLLMSSGFNILSAQSKIYDHTFDLKNVTISWDTGCDRVIGKANEANILPVVEEFVKDSDFTLVAGS